MKKNVSGLAVTLLATVMCAASAQAFDWLGAK